MMAKSKREIQGKVTSDRMQKTAIVEVTKFTVHPLYRKRMIKRKRYAVDNQLQAKIGQKVVIQESRPMSKTKKWRIIKILA
ncbi:30S ribosomal protein S17 [candidate division WWE3 bacterium CG06_land_8_20_14_3_00_42_16]|uniref:Small ribosomal subunit protein uS17 n=4 Tax=Katanobacteria TaxID=422282 RepID=A0A2M7AMT4_UNCKA|nr:MAG: 30S ribosomal protein S17 [bacterium CG1_02_42_9]PIU68647.1 MAG: 30S ribosomal protein S17 [candidate division WWE3 bacterium CG06_land_8_20_14_3_00_42_16]PIZ42998.1 MAG: 30S ribosomal protein S17 [candidate division WWE3 bacterium CG_4_10_14_0_2_um_filter_42_8]PJA37990.1 MAG: 30S ribosomal protein S17 [candidate division WWE3 bacterium CG_4_9_14_3_um_filter_43_9]PJC69368.1 MAG: 30S ribosomal protein S17 [candidate division WWE3 bacterium CG_4_8_14_3_um_filter_42_11]